MPKCEICGGEAPKQPCITEDGKCDLCGREVVLKDDLDLSLSAIRYNLNFARVYGFHVQGIKGAAVALYRSRISK
jgi:hypothetical protein